MRASKDDPEAAKIAELSQNLALGTDKGGNMSDNDRTTLEWRRRRLRCLLE